MTGGNNKANYLTQVVPATALTPLTPTPAPEPVPQGTMPYNAVPVFNLTPNPQRRRVAAPPTRSHNATAQAMFQRMRET